MVHGDTPAFVPVCAVAHTWRSGDSLQEGMSLFLPLWVLELEVKRSSGLTTSSFIRPPLPDFVWPVHPCVFPHALDIVVSVRVVANDGTSVLSN